MLGIKTLISSLVALIMLMTFWLVQLENESKAMEECQKKQSFEVCFYLIRR